MGRDATSYMLIHRQDAAESDEEYDPKKKKGKKRARETPISQLDPGRGNLYTLDEDHNHLLSASFDASFNDSGLGILGASSSQAGFGFEDDFLGGMDAANDIGDELARELGLDWGDVEKEATGYDNTSRHVVSFGTNMI